METKTKKKKVISRKTVHVTETVYRQLKKLAAKEHTLNEVIVELLKNK